MTTSIRAMTASDHAAVLALWSRTDGIGLNESDSEEAIAAYLRRNPEMSAVAANEQGEIVAAVLCGHDGRRGYLHHLAVDGRYRRQGIASLLLERCFEQMRAVGVSRCNLLVFRENDDGASFWEHNGWNWRSDLQVFQKVTGAVPTEDLL